MVMIIQHHTLHVLATEHRDWPLLLKQLRKIWQTGDSLVLAAEGIQGWHDEALSAFGPVYAIDSDAEIANIPAVLPEHIQVINHDRWAELILTHQRCLTWR
jgi:sulfur transfer complex TusBCD TusB component (DsrH family)